MKTTETLQDFILTDQEITHAITIAERKRLKERFKKLDVINTLEKSVKFLENMTTEQFSFGADKIVREDLKTAIELLKKQL
jgi:hypothetical protein